MREHDIFDIGPVLPLPHISDALDWQVAREADVDDVVRAAVHDEIELAIIARKRLTVFWVLENAHGCAGARRRLIRIEHAARMTATRFSTMVPGATPV